MQGWLTYSKQTRIPRAALLFGILTTAPLAACTPRQVAAVPDAKTQAQATIRHVFTQWQRQQIRAGNYWPADSCRPRVAARHANEPNGPFMGFPVDSASYTFSFADLNQDGKLDGVGLFFLEQCDGGNGARWSQGEVFVLSSPHGYYPTDSLRLDRFGGTAFDNDGIYNVDSIGPNRIYATYLELHQGATTCCPDVARPAVFDFAKRRLLPQ